jgi:transcriptional regulator with GAF, ATPase, and Fis domain
MIDQQREFIALSHQPESCSDTVSGFQLGPLVGRSPEMRAVFDTMKKVAATDSTVLITGESGTGKELIARGVHSNSPRRDHALVVINCGAIPGELLESELFGHEKGAFTGAHRTRIGRFELADGGTIFLDEIGDMSPNLQVKLLRVLQEQSFERVGSTQSIQVNIRVIAATNKDLSASMKEGHFREDLFYRLNVIPIRVPPLRQRNGDIVLLVDYFLTCLAQRRRQMKKVFSPDAIHALTAYDWPGNIRELENLMERLNVLIDHDRIDIADLPQHIRNQPLMETLSPPAPFQGGLDFNEAVEQYQKTLIVHALGQTGWVKAKAAELLKMNRTTLVEKIKKFNIAPPQDR